MKNILVPTDFSAYAKNAAHFALQLAKKSGAQVIFFNVVEEELPVLTEYEQQTVIKQIEPHELILLKHFKNTVTKSSDHVQTDLKFAVGNVVKEICRAVKKYSADIIIMGVQGRHALEQKIFGSVSTGVIKLSEIPVICIPENYRSADIKKLVFACDDAEYCSDTCLQQLKEITQLLNAELVTLKVFRFTELLKLGKDVKGLERLQSELKGVKFSYEYVVNEKVNEAIQEFADREGAGMIVMLTQKHGLLYKVWVGSHTRNMLFHTKVPLLVLHMQHEKVPVFAIE